MLSTSTEDIRQPISRGASSGWQLFRTILSRRPTLALIDQAIVSGTNVLTTIIIGRYCGSADLGLFALATSILVFAGGTQTSLVSTPYTVFRSRLQSGTTAMSRAGSSLVGACLLAGLLFSVAALTAGIISFYSDQETVIQLSWVLVLTIPLFLAREFGRRFDFARLNVGAALLVDAAVSVLQIALLALGAAFNQLSAAVAVIIIGIACASVFSVWIVRRRGDFDVRPPELTNTIHQDWMFGRWLFADHVMCVLQLYAMPWLLTFLVGTSAAGVFAACAAIAALASPFLQGAGNYLCARFAHTVSSGSRRETMRTYWNSTLVLGLAVTGFTAIVMTFGNELMWALFQDHAYADTGLVVGILALKLMFAIPTIAADHAVVAMERPRGAALSTLSGLAVTLIVTVPMILQWGVLGAAISLLIGTSIESFTLIIVFMNGIRTWKWTDE